MRKATLLLVMGLLAGMLSGGSAFAQAQQAKAELRNANGQVIGTATLTQQAGGVQINLQVTGLPAGQHGIHIHAVGKCDAPDFASAGGHFNPQNKQHGSQNPNGPHAGDIPNLDLAQNGAGNLQFVDTLVSLGAGENSLFDADGSALVIHAGMDDLKSDPAGNSGVRMACGVITASTVPVRLPVTGTESGVWMWFALAALLVAGGVCVRRVRGIE
ncbi:MAG: superoxide dismutase family protein [Chloroflexi bacterium]|nr:superoxide dismutase family protein [Chloroflexota bacterium]